jgi:hypothetical protein
LHNGLLSAPGRGRRRLTPSSFAAGAGGVPTVEGDSAPPRRYGQRLKLVTVLRRKGYLDTFQITLIILTFFRCKSTELFFACCDSALCIGLGTTMKYLRRTTSGAAGNGLDTTIKYLRFTTSGAAGSRLGTTTQYPRGAAGNGLGTTIKNLRRTTSSAAATAWAPRSSTSDAQRVAPRESA